MIYSRKRTDDIDELRSWWGQGEFETEVLQLGAGRLGYEGESVQLPGLDLRLQSYGAQALDLREAKAGSALSLGLVLEASAPSRIDGCALEPGRFLARSGQVECQAVLAPGTRSLLVDVDPELVGGRRAVLGIVSAPEPLRRELVTASRRLLDACRAALPDTEPAGGPLLVAREGVTRAVGALLGSGLQPVAPRATERERFAIVERARRRLVETRGKVSLPVLARELSVSERTLFRAFRECLGMGPFEVEQLRRLNHFRALLLARGPRRGRVAEAAAETGFTHLGRLSVLYRAHFGERPRETLRRNGRTRTAG
ncbi:MAG: helix-turn-helix domain-containing protein [Myxococcota bacterium]|nr:helix-turn-helix domain-containing protein [Myxococcota bacterium]